MCAVKRSSNKNDGQNFYIYRLLGKGKQETVYILIVYGHGTRSKMKGMKKTELHYKNVYGKLGCR